jgi:hypothetical protein
MLINIIKLLIDYIMKELMMNFVKKMGRYEDEIVELL